MLDKRGKLLSSTGNPTQAANSKESPEQLVCQITTVPAVYSTSDLSPVFHGYTFRNYLYHEMHERELRFCDWQRMHKYLEFSPPGIGAGTYLKRGALLNSML